MRIRSIFVVVTLTVVSAGVSSLATWQVAKGQLAAEDVLTLPIAAGPKKDRPGRFRVQVQNARFHRTPEDRMAADVSVRVVAVERAGKWQPVGKE